MVNTIAEDVVTRHRHEQRWLGGGSRPRFRWSAAVFVVLLLLVMVWAGGCDDGTSAVGSSTLKPAAGTTVSVSVTVTTPATEAAPVTEATVDAAAAAPVMITIVYDNTAAQPGIRADWGFACLVEGFEQTVLFDTGADGAILLSNLEALGFAPQDIDIVVLSHEHRDHIGGLKALATAAPDLTVYHPASFSERALAGARDAGATLVPVEDAVSPCAGLTVTAPQRGPDGPEESALLLDTDEGQVLIVGCAHPGVVEMVRAARDLTGRPVYAVLGGFHLMSHSQKQVDAVIDGLRELGVERCGPAHCTGEEAIARIQEAFGEAHTLTGD